MGFFALPRIVTLHASLGGLAGVDMDERSRNLMRERGTSASVFSPSMTPILEPKLLQVFGDAGGGKQIRFAKALGGR